MNPIFSIAVQSVTLPSGDTIHFRVNQADTSQCELHVTGEGDDGVHGTHIVAFKRNGTVQDQTFSATPAPEKPAYVAMQERETARIEELGEDDRTYPRDDERRAAQADQSLAGYKSVDDDAVRDPTNPSAMETKVSPVHGKINTAGADHAPVKPPEGTNADTPLSDRRDHAATGLQPAPRPR